MKSRLIEKYEKILRGEGGKLRRGTWTPKNIGIYNSTRLLKHLMYNILGLKDYQIKEWEFTRSFFAEYHLSSPLVIIYFHKPSLYARVTFPLLLRSVPVPGKLEPWPRNWTGQVIRITQQVTDKHLDWPDGFWTEHGKIKRAVIVRDYLAKHREIDLDDLTDSEIYYYNLNEVIEVLKDV